MRLTETMLRKIIREEVANLRESGTWLGRDVMARPTSQHQADMNTMRHGIGQELERVGRISNKDAAVAELERMIAAARHPEVVSALQAKLKELLAGDY